MTGTISSIISMMVTFEPSEEKKAREFDADHAASEMQSLCGTSFSASMPVESRTAGFPCTPESADDGRRARRDDDAVGIEGERLGRARIHRNAVRAVSFPWPRRISIPPFSG